MEINNAEQVELTGGEDREALVELLRIRCE